MMDNPQMPPPVSEDTDTIQLLIVREVVAAQAGIMKAMGFQSYFVASEMIAQAIVMVTPYVTLDQARLAAIEFFRTYIEGMQQRAAELAAQAPAESLPDGVLPFVRKPANDGAAPSQHQEQ